MRFPYEQIGGLAGAALLICTVALGLIGCSDAESAADERADVVPRFSVLVFSKTDTAGFRHASIPQGIETIRALGDEHYFAVDATEDASAFTTDSLRQYDAVIFLNTSGDVLGPVQQSAFERYVQSGGGFVGVHGASATEYDWLWYGRLVGAFFDEHPDVQEATINVANATHPSTLHLPTSWTRTGEWYNFRTDPTDSVDVLLTLDEASYEGGTMGEAHPIAWTHEYDGGRAFYTGLGHTKEGYADPLFRQHLFKGIEWAAGGFDGFVEPDFPFITTTVDAGGAAPFMPERNMAVRGIALQLGNDAYASFDPDLLRMSVGWTGDFLSLSTMAQVSYHQALNKQNDIPRVLGQPVFGTGLYPGWAGAEARFEDPRPPGPNPDDPGRGPLAAEQGRWNGLYVAGDKVTLSYTVRGVDILEQPGSVAVGGEVGITRTFDIGAAASPLTLVAGEVRGGAAAQRDSNTVVISHGAAQDSVTAVGLVEAPAEAQLAVAEERYVTLRLPAHAQPSRFAMVLWTGPRDGLERFRAMLRRPVEWSDVQEKGADHWPRKVLTRGAVAPDTSAYVTDELSLPLPNPWRRNVRAADVGFFDDGRAAVVTFSGDVWLVSGIDQDLERLTWKRFASGLYEPLSISVVDGEMYVYGREGIVRLHDRDGNGEADFYENFSNLIIQSAESREWPLDMAPRPGGGFFLSMGGALNAGPRTSGSEAVMKGFRLGSRHAGTITQVAPDGRSIEIVADGFREPYLGGRLAPGVLTASDQQGNFVPSTPIYAVREGGYYGVPATTERPEPLPDPEPPLTWIPHTIDQSGASQMRVTSNRMGPLSGTLLHLSYGRPGPFRVYADTTAQGMWQGGAVPLPGAYTVPTIKGAVAPGDGWLYMAGFQVFGSKAEQISSLIRLRYTGQPDRLPAMVRAGQQGVLLRFDRPLDPAAATDAASYRVRRWNYQRTEQYGSGHFKLDGTPGEETLPAAAAYLSEDQRSVFVVLPDMRPAMQLQVDYALESAEEEEPLENALYLTLNEAAPLDLDAAGFGSVDWQEDLARTSGQLAEANEADAATEAAVAASARRGRHIYQEVGCVACHSLDGTAAGKLGPTFKGLYGRERLLEDGTTAVADEAYIERSITAPARQIAEGYEAGMPSYEGILSDAEVASLVLFVKSLSESATSASAQAAPRSSP